MEIGLDVSAGKQREVQEICLHLCRWHGNSIFPGSQCVPLDRYKMRNNILKKKYFVSEKSDGFRYLLLTLNNAVFLIDNLFRVKAVPFMKFPNRGNFSMQNKTLLDGEMVQDRINAEQFVLRFLVFDIIAFNGNILMDQKLPDRLKVIQNDIIWPRKNDPDTAHNYAGEAFSVRLKDFYETRHIKFLTNEVIPQIPHPNEGIIFTPLDLPYIPVLNKYIFKWKPHARNSVDFQLSVEYRQRKPGYKLMIMDSNTRTTRDHAWISFVAEEQDIASKAEGKIVECYWDKDWKTFVPKEGETWEEGNWMHGGWRFIRVREDKKLPNDERMVDEIMRSITDDIKLEELVQILTPSEGAYKNSGNTREESKSPHMSHRSPSVSHRSPRVPHKSPPDSVPPSSSPTSSSPPSNSSSPLGSISPISSSSLSSSPHTSPPQLSKSEEGPEKQSNIESKEIPEDNESEYNTLNEKDEQFKKEESKKRFLSTSRDDFENAENQDQLEHVLKKPRVEQF